MVRPPTGVPFYGAILEGECVLAVAGHAPVRLGPGDFFLLPVSGRFSLSSLVPPPPGRPDEPVKIRPGIFHVGEPGPADARMLIGHYQFATLDAALPVPLLPPLLVVRGEQRLPTLVALLIGEAGADRPGRDSVLSRLLEVLLIEAFRTGVAPDAAPGLLRSLGDARLAVALRRLHADPGRGWTVAELARACGMSRSGFFDRFGREVGVSPMEYLLGWRMALAKDLLRDGTMGVGGVAHRVGYSAQSTFSVAFSRQNGISPSAFARNFGRPRGGTAPDHGQGSRADGF